MSEHLSHHCLAQPFTKQQGPDLQGELQKVQEKLRSVETAQRELHKDRPEVKRALQKMAHAKLLNAFSRQQRKEQMAQKKKEHNQRMSPRTPMRPPSPKRPPSPLRSSPWSSSWNYLAKAIALSPNSRKPMDFESWCERQEVQRLRPTPKAKHRELGQALVLASGGVRGEHMTMSEVAHSWPWPDEQGPSPSYDHGPSKRVARLREECKDGKDGKEPRSPSRAQSRAQTVEQL